jgi:hypothetical protein
MKVGLGGVDPEHPFICVYLWFRHLWGMRMKSHWRSWVWGLGGGSNPPKENFAFFKNVTTRDNKSSQNRPSLKRKISICTKRLSRYSAMVSHAPNADRYSCTDNHEVTYRFIQFVNIDEHFRVISSLLRSIPSTS